MVCASDANIPLRALDHMGIGTDLSRNESVGSNGTHPAGKRLGVGHLWVEPPAHLSDLIFPRLEIQMWWSRDHGISTSQTTLAAADNISGATRNAGWRLRLANGRYLLLR